MRKINFFFFNILFKFWIIRHVDDIDLYIGGISERSLSDGIVGPTFACIISHQFNDIRHGDRYFYETKNPSIGFTSGID